MRRGAKDAPTKPSHLTGQNVQRMLAVAPNAIMRLQTVTTMPTIEENRDFLLESTTFTFNQMAPAPHVGGSKSDMRGKQVMAQPNILMATTDRGMFSEQQQIALYQAGLLQHAMARHTHDVANGTVPHVPSTPEHVKKFNSPTKLDAHWDELKMSRKRANNEHSEENIEDELDGGVQHPQRRGWN